MRYIIVAFLALSVLSCAQTETQEPAAPPADTLRKIAFPTQPGTYTFGKWKYIYTIQNKGTRSEIRRGELFQNGQIIKGDYGDINKNPFGMFMHFNTRWNQGWLNTQTYNLPVFEEDGAK